MSEQQGQQPQQRAGEGVSSEMVELAEALRDAAAQLRSILDNANNPLALVALGAMQSQQPPNPQGQPQQAGGAGAAQQAQPPVRAAGRQAAGAGEAPPAQAPEPAEAISPLVEEARRAAPALPPPPPPPRREVGGASVERVLRLLSLFADMNLLPSEFFDNVVKAMGSLGVLSEGERDALLHLLNAVKFGVDRGLSPQEAMSLLAVILSEAGVDNEDAIREGLMRVILSKLRRQEESR